MFLAALGVRLRCCESELEAVQAREELRLRGVLLGDAGVKASSPRIKSRGQMAEQSRG